MLLRSRNFIACYSYSILVPVLVPLSSSALGEWYDEGETFEIVLNKHESYLMATRGDLTATQIRSNKRISVFSGNVRAKLPTTFKYDGSIWNCPCPVPSWYWWPYHSPPFPAYLQAQTAVVFSNFQKEWFLFSNWSPPPKTHLVAPGLYKNFHFHSAFFHRSRDHLVEQLIPFHAWGRTYYAARTGGRTTRDMYRVLAKNPGTVVTATATDGTILLNNVPISSINTFVQVGVSSFLKNDYSSCWENEISRRIDFDWF